MSSSGNLDSEPSSQKLSDLQQEVERLRQTVERLRSWAQFLAGGLLLALLIAMGISSWLALSLQLQERESRNAARQFASDRRDFMAQVEAVQSQVESLEATMTANSALGERVRSNQQALTRLQQRLNAISLQVNRLQQPQEPVKPEPPASQDAAPDP